MNRLIRGAIVAAVALAIVAGKASERSTTPGQPKEPTKADAERMIRAAEGGLAPVYAPLAEEIVERLTLADREGVGIDVGSGPGTLILELCRRTKLHWIDADINPYFFPYFLGQAEAAGLGGRVSAIRADACALPFRDHFADVIVSRGSFPFWPDLQQGIAETLRVLKPGGLAYIGRGLPERMPLETARRLRAERGEGPKYDPDETEQQLRAVMKTLGLEDYRIHRPRPNNPEGVNYGLWLQFEKPRR
ncbi:MAG: class I SAM-dependent methyltransferase [Planctomycetes bacterium]|nr:class I SAM-dependent methyltransferase [Planctomycetota bacterium]